MVRTVVSPADVSDSPRPQPTDGEANGSCRARTDGIADARPERVLGPKPETARANAAVRFARSHVAHDHRRHQRLFDPARELWYQQRPGAGEQCVVAIAHVLGHNQTLDPCRERASDVVVRLERADAHAARRTTVDRNDLEVADHGVDVASELECLSPSLGVVEQVVPRFCRPHEELVCTDAIGDRAGHSHRPSRTDYDRAAHRAQRIRR